MESLVEKWKNTINSKNFSSSFRESHNLMKNSLQSSIEKPPIKPSTAGFPSSIRKAKLQESSSSSDELSLELFKQPPPKKNKQNSVPNSVKKQEKAKDNTPIKAKNKDFIKENVYLILDLFDREMPLKERIAGIKKILEKVYEEGKNNEEKTSEEKQKLTESTGNKLKESKASFMNKIEGSSKMLSELETRLFQSEKEKLQLKGEKEQLMARLNKAEEDLKQKRINFELVERLQESHKLIEKDNGALLQELESANRRLHDQQKLFEHQVNELTLLFDKMRAQTRTE